MDLELAAVQNPWGLRWPGAVDCGMFFIFRATEDTQWHKGLQCDWLVAVVCGGEGSKEMFSSLKTWQIFGVHLRGVGILEFSLPLSYPSSSKVSLLSKAELSVVMKQSNKTSSDCWQSRCVEVV